MRALPCLAPLLLVACSGGAEAVAKIDPRSGSSVIGSAVFQVSGDVVTMKLAVEGITPGPHGIHMHEKGDCSAADAMSAGPHWNPESAMHGSPTAGSHHAGDMGNLEADASGFASLTFSNPAWTLGSETSTAADVVGRAIIIHASPDDFSQPAGNAGSRIACGVVVGAE